MMALTRRPHRPNARPLPKKATLQLSPVECLIVKLIGTEGLKFEDACRAVTYEGFEPLGETEKDRLWRKLEELGLN